MTLSDSNRPPRRRAVLGALAALAAAPAARAQALDKIRQRGTISFAIYKEMPPFNDDGKGVDIDLAEALAAQMGLKASILQFPSGENVGDDLRNMVWKGHYLGYGPADVMLHVPVEAPLIADQPKVAIFAPYYRERIVIARDLSQVPNMDSLAAFAGRRIAVAGRTLPGWLLIGADGGKYREQLITNFDDGVGASRLLLKGEVAAAAGLSSEIESVVGGNDKYAIDSLPVPRMRDGWVVGCAVKKESKDLMDAVQAAMNALIADGRMAALFGKARLSWRKP